MKEPAKASATTMRQMTAADIPAVIELQRRIYSEPLIWTEGGGLESSSGTAEFR
jgi:hypothetical protein